MVSRQDALKRLAELQAHYEQAIQLESPQERSKACEAIIKESDAPCELFTELKNTRSSWESLPRRVQA